MNIYIYINNVIKRLKYSNKLGNHACESYVHILLCFLYWDLKNPSF